MSDDERYPSGTLAALLPAIRQRRGLNAQALADRIKELGGKLDRAAVSKIENGMRGVSIDEALLLAVALDVAPLHLFLPRDDDQTVTLAPEVMVTATQARRWIRGLEPLPGRDDRAYRTEVPESEWAQRSQRLVAAETAVDQASRRHRVAREKLDILMGERSKLDSMNRELVSFASGVNLNAERQRLDARVEVALDHVAEAKVDLDDAREDLRRIRAEEG